MLSNKHTQYEDSANEVQAQREHPIQRLKSYICHGRATPGQRKILQDFWPQFGIEYPKEPLDFTRMFARSAPVFIEIGFGFGHSLLEVAKAQPQHNFIGIEAHRPGIGSLCMMIAKEQVTNIRIIQADAVEVLEKCIPDSSLAGLQIFFPDPWPKRRHQPRRLIQKDFVALAIHKLQQGGTLHCATDWEDYAVQMLRVLSDESRLENAAGTGNYAARSSQRPVITKFEARAIRENRTIADLCFIKR